MENAEFTVQPALAPSPLAHLLLISQPSSVLSTTRAQVSSLAYGQLLSCTLPIPILTLLFLVQGHAVGVQAKGSGRVRREAARKGAVSLLLDVSKS